MPPKRVDLHNSSNVNASDIPFEALQFPIINYEDIPKEVPLHIIKSMPFKTLITCQSTCKSWRNLIQTADIALAPARRHLLTFYNSLMRSPYFHYPDSTPNVKLKPQPKKVRKAKFNHEAEADCLRKYFQNVPDAFVMWTREWPGPIAVYYHPTYFGLRPKMVECPNYGTYEMRFWLVNRTKGEIWQVGVANARRACECPGVDKSSPYGIDPMQHQPHKRFEICLKILEPNK